MAKQRVLIADGLGSNGKDNLKKVSSIELIDATGVEREELKKKLKDVNILIVRSRTKVDSDLLEYGTNLKLVVRAGIGLDNVDVPAATDQGIVVMNAPTGNIVTTAEHAIALMFAISRHVAQADASLRSGKWDKKKFQGSELCGKTLGILGLGNIGKTVAERAIGLKMKVIGYDPYISKEAAARNNIGLVSLDELLAQADYVSIHVPLNEGTRHLLNEKTFSKMKKGAYLIHCARGGVVDEKAMLAALDKGQLSGCALDVFEKEPLPADSPLAKRSDVIITPHLGASTDEAQTQVGLEVADQITHYVEEGVLRNAVNVPNVSLEQLEILKPYLTLCERLGSFSSQAGPKDVRRIKVRFEGAISQERLEVLILSVLKGFLTPVLFSSVNFVNARKLMKERGIRVEETYDSECEDFSGLVEVSVEGEGKLTCSGAIFGKQEPRIVKVDNFELDALPSGFLLYSKNEDKPGVIGSMGSILGEKGVNISRMALGFDRQKGQAIALINIDSKVSKDILDLLRKTKGMISVEQIEF